MTAKGSVPPWADPRTPDRPWLDVREALPALRERPHFVSDDLAGSLRDGLARSGFRVVDAHVDLDDGDPERLFLQELTRRLGFAEAGAGHWGAFNDRLWDFLTAEESVPYAVVISGLDVLAESDTYHFVRCIHNLLSLTEGAGLSDSTANRQIEYFFVGSWRSGIRQ